MRLERKAATGFTLVEMAIVLVIIGIILAGVMKGRDIVRGSQVKQFSQQFAQKWQTMAQTYYDKTGQQLNDGGMNGGGATQNGQMDGNMMSDTPEDIVAACESVGLAPCTLIKTKVNDWNPTTAANGCGGFNIFKTIVEGEYSGAGTVIADLTFLNINANTKNLRRNVVLLLNVPSDVGIGLDTSIDGVADGIAGSYVNLNGYATQVSDVTGYTVNSNVSTKAWDDATDGNFNATAIIMDF